MLRKIGIALCLAGAAICLYLYFQPYIESEKGEQENEELIEEYVEEDTGNEYLNVDVDALKETNSDLAGWINIPNLYRFSYPIVTSHDNHEYLVTSFEGEESEAGTPFIDVNCKSDLSSFNTLIYGHYTPDRNFFGALYDIYDDEAYDDYVELQVYTLDHTVKIYTIVSIQEVNVHTTNLFTTGILPKAAKEVIIRELLDNSKYDYGATITTDDHLISLVCCTQSVDENERLIVTYKLVDEVSITK